MYKHSRYFLESQGAFRKIVSISDPELHEQQVLSVKFVTLSSLSSFVELREPVGDLVSNRAWRCFAGEADV